ncbi:hypothetical protein [Inquilinus limosus]|uniref:Uncharacterized protein n=1 Tax=Inquilinus limosus MP06 TaxID=1398085 RepID=A0A0A0D6A6_9PROT|nr:hypothetical protein [Inquilinus limosus]KGM33620.1 hypothetical protein P409_14795 [Inquilinus limosus MP06]
MLRGAALFAAVLAVSGCGIDPVTPKETRVDYAGFINSADQAAIYANSQCAQINRLAVFKAEDVVDGRKGATFQCLPVPNCYPAEAAAPGQPVVLAPGAVPVAAPGTSAGQPYTVPAAAAARLPGPVVAMAPVSSKRDRKAGRRAASGPSIEDQSDDTYIPFAAVPVAAGPQPQRVPSYDTINVPTGPNPVSAAAPGPQPVGSYATAAAPSWQRAVTCKPNQTLPLAVNRLPTGDVYPF